MIDKYNINIEQKLSVLSHLSPSLQTLSAGIPLFCTFCVFFWGRRVCASLSVFVTPIYLVWLGGS